MSASGGKPRFTDAVLELLARSGWTPGRKVPDEAVCGAGKPFPAAAAVLSEFMGLHIRDAESGIDCAPCDVELRPSLAAHVSGELADAYEPSLGVRLFPLGMVCRGHVFLVIDDQGRVYGLADGGLEHYAPNFDRALELLLLGKRAAPGEVEQAWQ